MRDPNRPRSRWRVAAVGLAVALLGAGAMLGTQAAAIAVGNAAMARSDFAGAERAYSTAVGINLVDRWIPHLDRGAARYRLRSWDAAAEDFATAAGLAPADWQCRVRLDWAAALEAGGDDLKAANDLAGALVRWQQAQVALADAPCPNSAGSSTPSEASDWENARLRIERKAADGAPTTSTDPGDSDADPSRQLDQRERQAQAERQLNEEQGPPSTGTGERTW